MSGRYEELVDRRCKKMVGIVCSILRFKTETKGAALDTENLQALLGFGVELDFLGQLVLTYGEESKDMPPAKAVGAFLAVPIEEKGDAYLQRCEHMLSKLRSAGGPLSLFYKYFPKF